MSEPIKVCGVAVMAPKQKAAAEAHCFGDCGKISMGGVINYEMTGGLFVCCEPKCPYMADELDGYGETMSFGQHHTVTLRFLAPLEGTP